MARDHEMEQSPWAVPSLKIFSSIHQQFIILSCTSMTDVIQTRDHKQASWANSPDADIIQHSALILHSQVTPLAFKEPCSNRDWGSKKNKVFCLFICLLLLLFFSECAKDGWMASSLYPSLWVYFKIKMENNSPNKQFHADPLATYFVVKKEKWL